MNSNDCLFCKIASGDISADLLFESDHVIAFRDINPQAPTHVLVIPRRHIATVNNLQPGDEIVVGELVMAAQQIAAQEGVAEPGYRLAMNCNAGAGQSVFHLHLHLLGGRAFSWPPG